ncbi:hypothetical protein M5D96_004970 [Drosophila gunungcola]|uniref:Seminal fluid protein n=1 Tax=Drosophila gunungcola TaxID=103775 RepID=A0A9Q0BT06_9MUSC|nr:hypothetical protein M5D96_004970 [Drosophila gunungcola]
MLLVLSLFSLLILVEGKNVGANMCMKRFNSDCQTRKLKWFFNPKRSVCSQRITCWHGFDYRTDCEQWCYGHSKHNNNHAIKLLEDIFKIVESFQRNRRTKKYRTKKTDKTGWKRTTTSVNTKVQDITMPATTKVLDTTKPALKLLPVSISIVIQNEDEDEEKLIG